MSTSKEVKSIKTEKVGNSSLTYYDENADLQRDIAERLLNSLEPWKQILPSGPIIELGCGTGFVSERLCDMYPGKEIEITDIKEDMVEHCRNKIGEKESVTFKTLDAEEQIPQEKRYSLTLSSFVAQWFQNPALTLNRWLNATKKNGLLLAALPGQESFPEWREQAEKLGIPFTANELPDTEEMVVKLSTGNDQVDYYEDTVREKYDSANDFFEHLKDVGAGKQKEGRHLKQKERNLLVKNWDDSSNGDITVSYHIIFIAVKKGEE